MRIGEARAVAKRPRVTVALRGIAIEGLIGHTAGMAVPVQVSVRLPRATDARSSGSRQSS
jgi:hypothetical protein